MLWTKISWKSIFRIELSAVHQTGKIRCTLVISMLVGLKALQVQLHVFLVLYYTHTATQESCHISKCFEPWLHRFVSLHSCNAITFPPFISNACLLFTEPGLDEAPINIWRSSHLEITEGPKESRPPCFNIRRIHGFITKRQWQISPQKFLNQQVYGQRRQALPFSYYQIRFDIFVQRCRYRYAILLLHFFRLMLQAYWKFLFRVESLFECHWFWPSFLYMFWLYWRAFRSSWMFSENSFEHCNSLPANSKVWGKIITFLIDKKNLKVLAIETFEGLAIWQRYVGLPLMSLYYYEAKAWYSFIATIFLMWLYYYEAKVWSNCI